MVPFPLPPLVIEHQGALLLVVHKVLDVTVKVVIPADEVTFLTEGATERIGAKGVAVIEPAIPGA